MKVFITYSKNNKMLVLVHFNTSTEKRSYLKLLYNVVECEYCKSNQRTFSCQYISGYNYYLFGYLFFIFSSCFFLFFFSRNFQLIHRFSVQAIMTNAVQHSFTSFIGCIILKTLFKLYLSTPLQMLWNVFVSFAKQK